MVITGNPNQSGSHVIVGSNGHDFYNAFLGQYYGYTASTGYRGLSEQIHYFGTRFDDVLAVHGGDISIDGHAGNDHIWFDAGNHIVNAGSGDDIVEAHAAYAFGTDPNVVSYELTPLVGNDGGDFLYGGSGFDTLSYGHAETAIVADLGKHTVNVGTIDTVKGFEALTGSVFDDKITGSKNADTLDGNLGNDFLRGKAGADTLTGGAGNDIFFYGKSDVGAGKGVDHITDFGNGADKLNLHDFFKGQKGAAVSDIVHITDGAAGSTVSVKVAGAFVDIAVLDGVHGVDVNGALSKGWLLT